LEAQHRTVNRSTSKLYPAEVQRRPVEGEDVPSRAGARRTDQFTEERDMEMEQELFQGQMNTGINFSKYAKIPVQARGSNVPPPMASV
jgi:hypothetical protein